MAHFATLQALAGFVFLIGLTFYFSEHKKAINWKLIISAFILQKILFLLIRYIPVVNTGLNYFPAGLVGLLDYAHFLVV